MLAVDIQYKYILQNVHSPTQRVHRNPPTGIYVPTFWGIHVSWRSSVHPSGAGLGNVHFVTYIFVSDICGQHLGDVCQLEVFCAPFGRRVRECIFFCNVYIGYMPPTFGEQMSVDFVHFPRAQLSGGPNSPLFQGGQLGPGQLSPGAQLSTFSGRTVGPRGPTVRGPIRLESYLHQPESHQLSWTKGVLLRERLGPIDRIEVYLGPIKIPSGRLII